MYERAKQQRASSSSHVPSSKSAAEKKAKPVAPTPNECRTPSSTAFAVISPYLSHKRCSTAMAVTSRASRNASRRIRNVATSRRSRAEIKREPQNSKMSQRAGGSKWSGRCSRPACYPGQILPTLPAPNHLLLLHSQPFWVHAQVVLRPVRAGRPCTKHLFFSTFPVFVQSLSW